MHRFCFFVCFLLLAGCDLPVAPGLDDFAAELAARKGRLVVARESLVEDAGSYRVWDLHLASSTGLEIAARLRVPASAAPGDKRTGVVLVGGRDTGRDAVRYLPDVVDELVVAPDYPPLLRGRVKGTALQQLDAIEAAAWDFAAALMLLADYLGTRPEVDGRRLVLIGASFGGFFATIAAAADARFGNAALLYTGAHLHTLVESNVKGKAPAAARQLGAELTVLPLQRLEPARYVGRIAPRPLLIVNGLYDDRIPRRSARALIRAARPPKDVVWLPTGHLSPDDPRLVRELVDSAFARMPLLRDGS